MRICVQSVLAVFNVCVNKSGLSSALPNAISENRKPFVTQFHSTVRNMAIAETTSNPPGSAKSVAEGQIPHGIYSWSNLKLVENGSSQLQPTLLLSDTNPAAAAIKLPPPARLGVAYIETMPYYLLPAVIGLAIAGILLPLFLLLFCLRNCKACRRYMRIFGPKWSEHYIPLTCLCNEENAVEVSLSVAQALQLFLLHSGIFQADKTPPDRYGEIEFQWQQHRRFRFSVPRKRPQISTKGCLPRSEVPGADCGNTCSASCYGNWNLCHGRPSSAGISA